MLKKLDELIITSLENKNIRVYNHILWSAGETLINNFLKRQHELNSKDNIVIFIVDDYEGMIESYKNQIILRTSLNSNHRLKNEIVLPYIWECSNTRFQPLPKSDLPIVSFCGIATKYRIGLITKIKNNHQIRDNFILRQHFWGGNPHNKQIIKDFNDNIEQSHFVICNRGAGNFSMRLYQTLAFGRIPLLLNTNMILPFEDIIDYNNTFIIGNNENEIIEKLLLWWKTKDIVEMQNKCYELYETFFKKTKYVSHLYNEIQTKLII